MGILEGKSLGNSLTGILEENPLEKSKICILDENPWEKSKLGLLIIIPNLRTSRFNPGTGTVKSNGIFKSIPGLGRLSGIINLSGMERGIINICANATDDDNRNPKTSKVLIMGSNVNKVIVYLLLT
jgi:hypothetical protein